MARSKITIDIDEVMQDDELEARQNAAEKNKKKLMRRKKRIRFLIIFVILSIFSVYMFTEYSSIRVIDVNGNKIHTKDQIMNLSKIDYSMKSILAPSFLIEKRLEKNPMIKEVNVHKSWDGIVRIDIIEENMIGYYEQKGKAYLMFKEGEDLFIKDESLLLHVPYLNGLTKKQREQYKQNLNDVSNDNIWMISEIVHHETSYNVNMLKLYMQDGHVVFTTMNGLSMLDNYLEMLKALNTTHKCITFVEETNSSYSEKCE